MVLRHQSLGEPTGGLGPNPLSQSQAQPLSLWSPPAGVLCLCHTQWVLSPCRPEPAEGAAGAAAEASYRPRMPIRHLQQSSPTVLSPPDKCPSGSEPKPSRQRWLKIASSKPPLVSVGQSLLWHSVGHSLRFLTRALVQKSHNAQQSAQTVELLRPRNTWKQCRAATQACACGLCASYTRVMGTWRFQV